MPENLPVAESIKKVESWEKKRIKTEQKKSLPDRIRQIRSDEASGADDHDAAMVHWAHSGNASTVMSEAIFFIRQPEPLLPGADGEDAPAGSRCR